MSNNRANDIFFAVIGVTTLIVAIIGATFAYFSADAYSNEDAITGQSTVLKLGYDDDINGLKTDLIPSADNIAIAGANRLGKTQRQCIDDNGNQICGVYVFTIGNPSQGTTQTIYGTLNVVTNEFSNLYFAIYKGNANGDAEGKDYVELNDDNLVVPITKFPEAGKSLEMKTLTETLIGSSLDYDQSGKVITDGFNEKLPKTYTLATEEVVVDGKTVTRHNKVTYSMVIWVHEIKGDEGVTDADQTKQDSGKTFSAGLSFNTSSGGNGVTGVIAAAGTQ